MTVRLLCTNCFKSVHNIEVVFYPSACFRSETAEPIQVRTKSYTNSPRLPILSILLAVTFESIYVQDQNIEGINYDVGYRHFNPYCNLYLYQ
jgi:hypothetical protein